MTFELLFLCNDRKWRPRCKIRQKKFQFQINSWSNKPITELNYKIDIIFFFSLRDIPCSNYQMHTAHCARNIQLCPTCKEPVPKREFEDHKCSDESDDEQPSPLTNKSKPAFATPAPTATSAPKTTPAPKTTSTPKPNPPISSFNNRSEATMSSKTTLSSWQPEPPPQVSEGGPPICQFCHLEFPGQNMKGHEEYCGSRTEKCPECSDFVMLKDWEKHQSMRLYHGKFIKLFSMYRFHPRKRWCFRRKSRLIMRTGVQLSRNRALIVLVVRC